MSSTAESTPSAVLNALLDEMDRYEVTEGPDPAEYYSARDAVFDLIERHPDLAIAARDYGLPV